MAHRLSRRRIRSRLVVMVGAALAILTHGACGATRESRPTAEPLVGGILYQPAEQPFAISLVPSVPLPIRLGTTLGFRVSSGSAGYASLYLIDPAEEVWALAENIPMAAGSVDYPSPEQGFTLTAAEPLGDSRVILLVTREPIDGFSGGGTLRTAVGLALRGNAFVERLNRSTRALAPSGWAIDQITVSIVA